MAQVFVTEQGIDGMELRSMCPGVRITQVQVLALPANYKNLGKLLVLSVTHFSHLLNGDNEVPAT